jgi:hypothetical protein
MNSELLKKAIDELTSPMFRIMTSVNLEEPGRRQLSNDILGFHIGDGYFLSVAHNLRTSYQIPRSLPVNTFQTDILDKLDDDDTAFIEDKYNIDPNTQKKHVKSITDQAIIKRMTDIFVKANFNTSHVHAYENNYAKPICVIHFRDHEFYGDSALNAKFDNTTYIHEVNLNRHTYILELEYVDAVFEEDVAIYKVATDDVEILDKLPSLEIDWDLYANYSSKKFYCLQSSPSSPLGKILNNATIEGISDHWNSMKGLANPGYIMEGVRYMIKGYFRFGSSGAPYLLYDEESDQLKACAIQSEACPVQLQINKKRDGNFQYTHALATPLNNVREKVEEIKNGASQNKKSLPLPTDTH